MSDRTIARVARVVRVAGGTGATRILESLEENGDSLVRSASSTSEVSLAIVAAVGRLAGGTGSVLSETIRRVVPTVGVELLIAPVVEVVVALVTGVAVLDAGPATVTPLVLVLTIEFTADREEGCRQAITWGQSSPHDCRLFTGLIVAFDLFL